MKQFACNRFSALCIVGLLVFFWAINSMERPESSNPAISGSVRESVPSVSIDDNPLSSPFAQSIAQQPSRPRDWCDPTRAQQLANHAVFAEFDQWLSFFEKTHCSDQDACLHKDPRHLLFAHQSPARRFSRKRTSSFPYSC